MIVSFLNRAGILPKQPANASNVILELNPAFPNVIVEKRLHDGVNHEFFKFSKMILVRGDGGVN